MATTRKTPQDHKKSQAEIQEEAREALAQVAPLSETPGHEFLRPLSEIDGFEQMELLALFDDAESQIEGFKVIGQRVRDEFVIDPEGFKEFNTGAGAGARLMKLIAAFVAEMGKGIL